MPVYNKRGILLLPKVIVLNPKDGYRRIQGFKESGISRKSVNRKFCDELLLEKVKSILYEKGG